MHVTLRISEFYKNLAGKVASDMPKPVVPKYIRRYTMRPNTAHADRVSHNGTAFVYPQTGRKARRLKLGHA